LGTRIPRRHVSNPEEYTYDHVHDAASMAFILKELAGADELRTMKLAPAPNTSKANAVAKYKSILQNANDSWDGASSYADSTNYDDSDSS